MHVKTNVRKIQRVMDFPIIPNLIRVISVLVILITLVSIVFLATFTVRIPQQDHYRACQISQYQLLPHQKP